VTAAGAIGGAALTRATRMKMADGQDAYRVPLLTGAIAGTLVASTAGAAIGVFDRENEGVAETGQIASVIGVGSLAVSMLYGLAKSYLAPPALSPAAPASSPVTLPVMASDSGRTLAAKVGDIVQIQLPSTLAPGGASPWTWDVPAQAPLQRAQPVAAAGGIEVDSFMVTGPGSTRIVAQLADPSGATPGATFVLNLVTSV